MDDIPNNTPIDSYGSISDLFINRIQLIMQNGILDFENSGDKVYWKPIK